MYCTHARKTETIGGRLARALTTLLPLALIAFAAPNLALAQLVQTTAPGTYTPLVAPAVLQTDVDDGATDVTVLPFPITYYGQAYTTMTISHNGAIQFPSGDTTRFNDAPNTTATPNTTDTPLTWIGPFWDDLRLYAANTGHIATQTLGTAPNRRFVVEFLNISRFGASAMTFSMQVHFLEGSTTQIEVHYGPVNGTASTFNATAGMEDHNGANGFIFAPSGCTSACTITDLQALSGNVVTIAPPVDPELTGAFTAFDPGGLPGAAAAATITQTNFATRTATSVVTDIWLSTDGNLDPGDTRVLSSTTSLTTGDTVQMVNFNIPTGATLGGQFLILDVDATDLYNEVDETDNIIVVPFAVGYDFSAPNVMVTNTAGINPGENIGIDFDLVQGGAPFSGSLEVTAYASADVNYDMADQAILTTMVTANGSAMQSFSISGALPAIAPGQYYVILRLDPMNTIPESNETNNSATGNTFDTGPDFIVANLAIPTSVTPGTSATVVTTIDNLSVPFTGILGYTLYASADDTLDTTMDMVLGNYQAGMAGESTLLDMQSVPFPMSMPAGYYYVFVVLDPMNVVLEVDETNNEAVAANRIANAVDFAAAQATSMPTSAEVGDPITVTADVSSLGLSFVGNVRFQVHLSPDPIFDPGDTAIYRGFVFFPGGNSTGSIDVTFPLRALQGQQPLIPGGFTVFVVTDPDDIHLEADEMNNAGPAGMLTIQGADLLVDTVDGADSAFIGLPYEVNVAFQNIGVADARSFQYAYYLSDNDIIRVTDRRVFISQTATIASGSSMSFTDQVTLPTFTSTQTKWLGVIVDIFSAVPETSETNNTRRIAHPIEIVFPIPDLVGQIIETATAAAAGEDLAVTRIIENIGVAPSGGFEYSYYLSSNPTIATDDILLGTFNSTLDTGEDDYGVDVVTLPSNISEGSYYVGLILDPSDAVNEILDDNNAVLGPQIPVFASALQFLTDTLPPATLGVDYDAAVYAQGGPLPITWAVADGALPDGVTIDAASGILSGTPTAEGLFDFTLRALSGTAFAERMFSIRVTAATVELTVATPSLPTAIVGRPYSADLIAVGGAVPYTWSSISTLPTGLELSESGVVSGTPTTPGGFELTINVRDDLGNTDSKTVGLNITNANQAIQVTQIPLPPAEVNVEYCDPEPIRFEAVNGVEPYSWSIVGTPPAGIRMSPEGELCGIPERVGEFSIVVRAQDSTGLFDTSLFVLEVTDGGDLAISTFEIDAGEVGKEYTTDLTAIRGTEPYTWSVVEAWGPIAPGLTLNEDGFMNGTPTAAGTFAFVVQVTDAVGRADVQPLTIVVAEAPVPPTEDSGCSCEATNRSNDTGWMSMMALIGLGTLLTLRRRRAWLGLLAFAVVATTALPATAQTPVPGTPYLIERGPATFVPLPTPNIVARTVDDGQVGATLPFPVRFYGTMQTSISIGYNGAIAFPSGTSITRFNNAPGTTGAPSGFIAPMWDDLYSSNGHIATQVQGTAPGRTFTVEWLNIHRFINLSTFVSFQVVFHEGQAGRIDINYGPATGAPAFNATMGMEDTMNAQPILFATSNCTTNCLFSDFPVNTRVTVIQDPGVELIATAVDAPEFGFLGAQTPVSITASSLHGNPIGPFTVEVVASPTADLQNPVSIGTAQMSLTPFERRTMDVITVPPISLGEGQVYLGLNVDSDDVIMEVNEGNNSVASTGTIRLIRGLADVAVQRVRTSAADVAAGGMIDVYSTVQNVGGEPAPNVDVGVMLSTNPVISRQDVTLDTYTVSLAPGETVTTTRTISIDAATNSGAYYFGALADPPNVLEELSESNNGRADINPVTIAGGALAVATAALPRGYLRVTYVGLLVAAGGDPNDRTWEITSGELPTGIGLVPSTGEIFGRPTVAETQTFTVQVSSGGDMASAQLTLTIADPQAPLTIVTREVAAGVVGQEYAFPIVVTGGAETSSLAWTAENLPDGFMVTELGVLAGNPMVAGTSTITINVTDGLETASRVLQLQLRDNANLLIRPNVLSTARFNEAYSERLESTGGLEPITWLVQLGRLPAGLDLSTSGEISGTPTQVGTFRFVVEARDASTTGLPAKDVNTFELVVVDTDGFSIVTESLPDAVVGEGYEATLEAMGGLAPYTWNIVEGRLPEGLIADVDEATGNLRVVGQTNDAGVRSLLIEVVDSQGRTATKAFSITVAEFMAVDMTPVDDGGCTCVMAPRTASWTSFAGLLLVGLALLRRRR